MLETRDESTKKAVDYIFHNYGADGRQAPMTAWAKFATLEVLSHNLHIERYHLTIKMVLKPNMNLVLFCLGLKKINKSPRSLNFERRSLRPNPRLALEHRQIEPDLLGDENNSDLENRPMHYWLK
eukprot:TCALIF_12796-PA protein Name:"Protein of unknown function" AED:0.59 eAED:0.59 QI:0/0/0/0.33/1/1/3/0/124